jgi:nudix-type nucleoside diphosphatase (YffH/AdpP family)
MADEVRIINDKVLSDKDYILKNVTYNLKGNEESREVYDRGNGATILLYNVEKRTVLLTRQFRLPSFLNGNSTGMLIETCAGFLDGDEPEFCARRESEEETGYKPKEVKKVFELYSSPGGITELLHYFIAPYTPADKVSKGGGLEEENEHVEILELPLQEALRMVKSGEIKDAKTVVLLQYLQIQGLIS